MLPDPETPGTPHAPSEQNGAGLRPDAATLIGRAAGKAVAAQLGGLLQALPQMLAEAAGDKPMCGRCAVARARWDRLYGEQVTFARLQACEAAGISPDDPASARVNVTEFMPASLRPGAPGPDAMPPAYLAAAYVNGWGLCHPHIVAEELAGAAVEAQQAQAAAEQQAAAQKPGLLLARPGVNVSAAAAAARVNAPGMPGYASP